MLKNNKTVSLVLGSGGARGLAHIGVIHWLEENGFQIKSISGCSIGSLVGGIYAAGKLDEFEKWIKGIDKIDILTLLDLSWGKKGLVKGDKIIKTLVEIVGNPLIQDLPMTFTAVAADVKNEKEIWMSSGKLFDAIRASISLPLFFTPFKYKGLDLIDGGVLNPVPIAPTFSDDTALTIAINLGGPVEAEKQIPVNNDQKDSHVITDKVSSFVEKFKLSAKKVTEVDLSVYDIANQAFDAMQGTIARQKLAAYPPDINIEIARNACGTLEFDRASEMIELGYVKAKQAMADLVFT